MHGLPKSYEGLHAHITAIVMTLNLQQDRSLGAVELHVTELAKESDGDPRYPFESLGKKEATDPLRLDHGTQFKGNLHYVAEFIPALALRGVEFKSGPNAFQQTADEGSDAATVETSASSAEDLSIPLGITATRPLGMEENTEDQKSHKRSAKSMDTIATVESTVTDANQDPTTVAAKVESGEAGVTMIKEELLKQRMDHLAAMTASETDCLLFIESGVIVFHIVSGQLSKKGRLEVLMDDGYWPAFTTTKAPSTNAHWQHVGEGFVKELDFGRVWLRLNANDEEEKDDIIAEWKGDVKPFLETTLVCCQLVRCGGQY
jgi:Ca2+-dependent lipid-binding protein